MHDHETKPSQLLVRRSNGPDLPLRHEWVSPRRVTLYGAGQDLKFLIAIQLQSLMKAFVEQTPLLQFEHQPRLQPHRRHSQLPGRSAAAAP
jgi:hypothetical protein